MQFPHGEQVTVSRTGDTVLAGWDPSQNKLYADFGEDLRRGDVLEFLGLTRRVTVLPESWRSPFTGWSAGQVVTVEDADSSMPDVCVLLRVTGEPEFDPESNTVEPAEQTELWSGPCAANPTQSDASGADLVGEQRLSSATFRVALPLEVVDILPDDVLVVTTSRDLWLSPPDPVDMSASRTVPLRITRVLGGTDALQREVLAVLNEG